MQYILLRIFTICALVLLPLIPACIIFTKFPSKNHVKGPFKGLTLNLTGAFAGYFITLIVCGPFIPSIFKAITKQEVVKLKEEQLENEDWTIQAYIKFKYFDSTEINNALEKTELLKSLNSQISLPSVKTSPDIEITLPRPDFMCSDARQLHFSAQSNWIIYPNTLSNDDIKAKMKEGTNKVNLDTILVMVPPPERVETNLQPISGTNDTYP